VLTAMRNHRGFTLVEVLVAMVVMLTVTGAIYKLLYTSQRLSNAQAAQTDMQSNERAASLIVPSELRELSTVAGGTAAQNDILDAQPTSIRYRAMRGTGFVCQPAAGLIRIWQSTWSGYRQPQPTRDSAFVFFQTDPTTGSDGTWQMTSITAVTTATNCPDGTPGYTLTVPGLPAPAAGVPVHLFEDMELGLYVNGGKSWLGARSVSMSEASQQPVLGPLKETTGFTLKYYDQDGVTETTDKTRIRSIRITIKGITNGPVSTSGGSSTIAVAEDSVVSLVTLRNALR
jgi:prepilin-type N-terminal cleavage/methylation domain-containing protein